MHLRAGVITGAMTGSSIEAAGTDGIATQYLHLRRCRSISVNTQETDILSKCSNSNNFNSSITIISRMTR